MLNLHRLSTLVFMIITGAQDAQMANFNLARNNLPSHHRTKNSIVLAKTQNRDISRECKKAISFNNCLLQKDNVESGFHEAKELVITSLPNKSNLTLNQQEALCPLYHVYSQCVVSIVCTKCSLEEVDSFIKEQQHLLDVHIPRACTEVKPPGNVKLSCSSEDNINGRRTTKALKSFSRPTRGPNEGSNTIIIVVVLVLAFIGAATLYYFVFSKKCEGKKVSPAASQLPSEKTADKDGQSTTVSSPPQVKSPSDGIKMTAKSTASGANSGKSVLSMLSIE